MGELLWLNVEDEKKSSVPINRKRNLAYNGNGSNLMEEKKEFFACYLAGNDGIFWYSFGLSRDHLADGVSEMEAAYILPCTEEAYRKACEGKWDEIAIVGENELVDVGSGSGAFNVNPPVVHAAIEGRDL